MMPFRRHFISRLAYPTRTSSSHKCSQNKQNQLYIVGFYLRLDFLGGSR
jgi:hypothetical protein